MILNGDIILPFLKKIKDEDIVAQKKENVRLKHAKNLIFLFLKASLFFITMDFISGVYMGWLILFVTPGLWGNYYG
ncbi:hypothetical protein [Streptococcus suis]|uniref:hypothetical protein n=1 Tax=Streptococcus suis TaxID=1307 RepID=UPI0015D4CCC3|nr:hypothetical protein [Streptococcus suis]